MAGLYAPLPTLRRRPRGRLRTARGRCGSLLLHRSGLPPHTPCRSPGALTRVAARTLARSPIRDLLHRGLQPFRHLHDCSGCFRLERSPGGARTRWKAPPSHGAHVKRPSRIVARGDRCGTNGGARLPGNGRPRHVLQSRHLDVGIGVPVLQTPTTICYLSAGSDRSSGRAPRIAAESAVIRAAALFAKMGEDKWLIRRTNPKGKSPFHSRRRPRPALPGARCRSRSISSG